MSDLYGADRDISFGPKDTDKVSPEWASAMLTDIKATHPQIFGEALQRAIGIEPATGRRTRSSSRTSSAPPPPLSVAGGSHAKSS